MIKAGSVAKRFQIEVKPGYITGWLSREPTRGNSVILPRELDEACASLHSPQIGNGATARTSRENWTSAIRVAGMYGNAHTALGTPTVVDQKKNILGVVQLARE